MGRAYMIQNHPLHLREWTHAHHGLVRAGLTLIVAALAVAIAKPTASMVGDAIAGLTAPAAGQAEAASGATLPREWIWSREPITFDHMYRDGSPHAAPDFIRGAHRAYSGSASE